MSIDTVRAVEEIPRIARGSDAREVALAAYDRLLDVLERLEPEEWTAPTECPAWDVAAMVGHLIGAGKAAASPRESLRQQRWARRHAGAFDGNTLDAANALQVADHAALSREERLTALRAVAAPAVRGRMRLPALLRRVSVPLDPGGSTAPGMPKRLGLGALVDVVYTRDVWLHRVDIARATGHRLDVDGVDARIVADVVAEWAARHRRPFRLTLTGPAGGQFRQGQGGPHLETDAVELCRTLSGRAPGEGLLATRVVF